MALTFPPRVHVVIGIAESYRVNLPGVLFLSVHWLVPKGLPFSLYPCSNVRNAP